MGEHTMQRTSVDLRISDAALLQLLKKSETITMQQASLLQQDKKTTGKSIQELAIKNGFIKEADIAKLYAPRATKSATPTKHTLTPHLSGRALLTNLLTTAVAAGATTIHIEPQGDVALVRLRIDGLLYTTDTLKPRASGVLLAHIKAQAGLAVTDHAHIQQTKLPFVANGEDFVASIAALPTTEGEKLTISITPAMFKPTFLEDLGYWGANATALRQALAATRGLIVVSGPHFSGLTTTFLQSLHTLTRPYNTIVTLETSVLQHVPGLHQSNMSAHSGLTNADQLLSLSHHDPDVIGIDQLHDPAITRMAVDIAAQGRLVVATMTGDSASQALSRLSHMAIEPYLVATTVRSIVNQRLARRLCEDCKQPYRPSPLELTSLMRTFGVRGGGQLAALYKLEKEAASALLTNKRRRTTAKLHRARPDGCDQCQFTGYKGHIGIHEVLIVDSSLERLIVGGADATTIEKHARQTSGAPSLRIDALLKALLGITSADEVLRVL